MQSIYVPSQKKFITYSKYEVGNKKSPWVIYVHGLMSSSNSTKASRIQEFCQKQGYNYIKFDNFGCGDSGGLFAEETISSWLEGVNFVIRELAPSSVILVGSSAGAWLSILASIQNPAKVISVVTIAAAIDFTEELIWQRLSNDEKKEMEQSGICGISQSHDSAIFPISYNLIQDAREHLLLSSKQPIHLTASVHIIHGMNDDEVPHNTSLRLAQQIHHDDVTIKLAKGGKHKMLEPKDLNLIYSSLNDIMFDLKNIQMHD